MTAACCCPAAAAFGRLHLAVTATASACVRCLVRLAAAAVMEARMLQQAQQECCCLRQELLLLQLHRLRQRIPAKRDEGNHSRHSRTLR
jgi:hypothetical protein